MTNVAEMLHLTPAIGTADRDSAHWTEGLLNVITRAINTST